MKRFLLATTVLFGAFATQLAAEPANMAVNISFAAEVNGQPLTCNQSYAPVGTTGASLQIQDFRIFVSEVRLISEAGHEVPIALTPDDLWQDDKVTLLDFENATGACNGNTATNTVVRGTVPDGRYTGIVFVIGVPFEINHQDPTLAPPPLNFSATAWPWRVGYKFTTIDLETAPAAGKTATATGFSIHLGSTACGEGPYTTPPTVACANGNRPEYRFADFDVTANTLVLDLGQVLAATDITTNAPKSASGCMSFEGDVDCVALFDRLGLAFDGKPSNGQHFVFVK